VPLADAEAMYAHWHGLRLFSLGSLRAYSRRMRATTATYRLLVVAAAMLVIASLSGCTSTNPADPTVGSTSPPATKPASDGLTLGDGPTTLSCSQRSGGSFSDVDSALGGRIDLDLLSGDPWSTVPLARDVNLTVPADQDWLFRKSPITVAAGTESVTVSVPDDGKQFLAWVPYSIWTSGTPPDLSHWSQTSITIQPCADQAAGFLGGVLALTASQCFTMHFQTATGLRDDRQVRLDGQACDQ